MMTNEMTTAFIGIGSNLGDSRALILSARDAINNLPETKVQNMSPLYKNPPMGPQDQTDFINSVTAIHTALSPEQLLDYLQAIEKQFGRQRLENNHWGPRTLDLDILLYDHLTIHLHNLQIPHYDMKNRYFVLYPLAQIAPELTLPDGTTIHELLKQCPITALTPI